MKSLLIIALTILLLVTWATAVPSEMDLYQVTEEVIYYPKLPEHSYIDRRLQDAQLASRAEVDRGKVFVATAYTAREAEGTADGITFTGTRARPGVVAVDPEVIPLGSWLYIESSFPGVAGWYHAEDVGGAIKGARVDIFMTELDRALKFGRREVRVRVFGERRELI